MDMTWVRHRGVGERLLSPNNNPTRKAIPNARQAARHQQYPAIVVELVALLSRRTLILN